MAHRGKPKVMDGYVVVVDIGYTSLKFMLGGSTIAERIKECVTYMILHKIFSKSSDEIGIVLCGSEDTANPLYKEGKSYYENIKVLSDMKPSSWDMAKMAGEEIRTSTCDGDLLDALGVALDLIHQQVEQGTVYGKTKILVVSGFYSPCRTSKSVEQAFISALRDKQTELYIIGSSFTDSYSIKDEKPEVKEAELVAQRIVEHFRVKGEFMSFDDFYGSAVILSERPKIGNPWNVTLDIGPEIRIPVTGYIKVKKGECLRWKEETSDASLVDKEVTYQKGAGEATTHVDKEDLVTAYKYGTEYVTVPAVTLEKFKYHPGVKCLTVLAFVEPVPTHLYMGTGTMYFFAQKDKSKNVDEGAQKALSALAHAMNDMGRVALVRRVYNTGSRVQLGILAPRIKLDYECLVYNEVPFSDDYRQFEFPPIITSKNQPSDQQLKAIDELIDSFDLMIPGQEMEPKETVDLQEEYLRHAVAFKVIHPEEPLLEMPPHVKSNITPLPSMLKGAQGVLDQIKELFPLEVVDRLRVNGAEAAKRESVPATGTDEQEGSLAKKPRLDDNEGIDLMSILGSEVVKIGTANPVQDYLTLLKKKPTEEVNQEMEKIITDLLRDSGGTNTTLMNKSRDCLRAYRQHAMQGNRAPDFNRWMARFKQEVIDNYFHAFWQPYVVDHQLGLITREESAASDVQKEEAQEFFQLPRPADVEKPAETEEDLTYLI